nr:isochorismate synthase MenF [uncultured Enterobacter sp.]
MSSISTALEYLQQRITDDLPHAPGLRIFDVNVPLNDGFDALSWLASQSIFPQFYWQQRSGDEELAMLGSVHTFPSLALAQQFLHQHPLHHDLRIGGVNAFDPEQGALFLPRLEWRRTQSSATLRLTLCSALSLYDDGRAARDFLRALVAPVPLAALHPTLITEQHHPDRQGWQQLLEHALAFIERGEFDKVVLARASDYTFSAPVNAASLMAASRRVNHHCYHFFMAFEAGRAFLGSTPERLWRRRGMQLRTEALAGTVASHPVDEQAQALGDWLMKDDKNQRENMLVVEDICQRLQSVVALVDVLPPQVVRLRKVQHLRRCIWTELRDADDEKCLIQLQPTAAVAGLPREKARAFIQQHEPFSREGYAGSAGYLSLQQSEFCVALRSASVTQQVVRLYAGAGIVRGSDPAQEWQEIENKAAGLRSLLLMD